MKRKGNLTGPEVLRLIERRIENGKFRPGDRLIPAVIARELGGSTIPVREALCHLVGRDILTERRNKGFTVTPMTSATLRSLYAAHGEIIEKAFLHRRHVTALLGRTRSRWPLFAAIADHTGNEGIMGVQRYLAGRLAVARKYEGMYADTEGLVSALRREDAITAQLICSRFHAACTDSSSAIWQTLSDR